MVDAVALCSAGVTVVGADTVLGCRRKKLMTRIMATMTMPSATLMFIRREVYPMIKGINKAVYFYCTVSIPIYYGRPLVQSSNFVNSSALSCILSKYLQFLRLP